MSRYAIGLDFGTLSVRAMALCLETGEEFLSSAIPYAHGVIEKDLPVGFALQDPRDYLEGMLQAIRSLFLENPLSPKDVAGIGVDFTSSTVLPIKKDGTLLVSLKEFSKEPHALAKLWKHHGAQKEADEILALAKKEGVDLQFYGNGVSPEWMIPKILETLRKAPRVYREADYFVEGMDYVIGALTGTLSRSENASGYKAFYQKEKNPSEPPPQFYAALDPELENLSREKLLPRILPVDATAGYLTPQMAALTSLPEGTPVAAGMIDAHAGVLGCGITEPGILMIVAGTSSVHLLLSKKGEGFPGIPGVVKDGILPGYYAYEAGQCCVGDLFDRFVQRFVPPSYHREAREKKISVHALLEQKLEGVGAGDSGLLALDWENGVRSPLMDHRLSGLILGMDLDTTPEEIYLALMESTAFGTRRILECLEAAGGEIREILLGGGIPFRNRRFCQIYADVCKMPLSLAGSPNASLRGSAVLGAAVEKKRRFSSLSEAAKALGKKEERVYLPNPKESARYDLLYQEYLTLSRCFGEGENPVMYRLKAMRKKQS